MSFVGGIIESQCLEDSRHPSCGTAFTLVGLVFAGHVLLHIVSVLWANGLPVLTSYNSFSSPALRLFLSTTIAEQFLQVIAPSG